MADRIEKSAVLPASRARVWRALTDAAEFGSWFGVNLAGPFREGATAKGNITNPGYEHIVMELVVERMETSRLFSWRWHPYAIEPEVDYSQETPTLVAFTLEDDGAGTLLTVVESGFDRIPAERREKAYAMNSGGWEYQMRSIQKYLA